MKKLNKPISKEYLPVKLFLEDLKSIEELLLINKIKHRIEHGNLEFSNVSELQKEFENQSITNLKISSSSPYLNIELHKMRTNLYIGSNNNFEAGLFYKLDQIISKTIRRPSFIYSYYNLLAALCVYIFMLPITTLLMIHISILISGVITLFLIIWIMRITYILAYKHSEIILSKKHDMASFLSRNKDPLIVNLITTTVGAVLGILATILAYKMGYLK